MTFKQGFVAGLGFFVAQLAVGLITPLASGFGIFLMSLLLR
jgi:hypothetical protein